MSLKRQLRKLIASRMNSLSKQALKTQSVNIANVLGELPEYQRAKRVACFLHMETGEIETTEVIRRAFADGKTVYLPRIVPLHSPKRFDKESKELDMIAVTAAEIDALKPEGPYGLREPLPGRTSTDDGGLDLVVLPGVAFTSSGQRLGHGKGFYDSFLARHDEWSEKHGQPKPFTVAIGAQEQLVHEIPTEEHDRSLDAVITNDKLYRPQRSAG